MTYQHRTIDGMVISLGTGISSYYHQHSCHKTCVISRQKVI